MTEKMKNIIGILIFVDFVKNKIESDKVRDHCHLTGKYRGPAHNTCNTNVTPKKVILYQFYFTISVTMIVIFFVKKLVDKKNDEVKFDIIPTTNEEYIPVTNGGIRIIDSYPFLSSGIDSLVKTLVDNSHKILKVFQQEIVHNGELLKIVNVIYLLLKKIGIKMILLNV